MPILPGDGQHALLPVNDNLRGIRRHDRCHDRTLLLTTALSAREATLLANDLASRDGQEQQSTLVGLLFKVGDEISVPDDQLPGSGKDLVGIDLVQLDPPFYLGDRLFLRKHRGLRLLGIRRAGFIICSTLLVSHKVTAPATETARTAFPSWHLRV